MVRSNLFVALILSALASLAVPMGGQQAETTPTTPQAQAELNEGEGFERPETQVTHCTGHMGNTSSRFKGGKDALEGVFGDGRTNAVCGSPASRRADGGTLQGVRYLPQDRLQDLRSLSGMWPAGAHGLKPASLSLRQPTSFPGGELRLECEARAPQLGCSKNPRTLDSQVLRHSHSCQ